MTFAGGIGFPDTAVPILVRSANRAMRRAIPGGGREHLLAWIATQSFPLTFQAPWVLCLPVQVFARTQEGTPRESGTGPPL